MKLYLPALISLSLLALASTSLVQQARPLPKKRSVAAIKNVDASIAQRRQAIDFIKTVKKSALESSQFRLENRPASLGQMNCLAQVLADRSTFTQSELNGIEARATRKAARWSATEFAGIKLLEADTIEAIFKDKHKWWTYFHAHIGSDFNTFSMPIFIRHNTYCLFYTANYCGGLCAGGSLVLYKKSGADWVAVKGYCEWES